MTATTPRPEPPEERRAASIVAVITGCTTRRLDTGDGVQRPDFALVSANGQDIGLLEVTTISSQSYNSFYSRKARKDRSWVDPALRSNWMVTVDRPERQLRTLRKPVAAALPGLEAAGVGRAVLRPTMYRVPMTPLPAELVQLGIVEARALGAAGSGGGFVAINVWPTGGAYGIESGIGALEVVLSREDNRKKLAGSHERRELFVWVDPPSVVASALSTFSEEPWRSQVAHSRSPNLPAEATAVWAALWSDGQARLANALWRGDASGWRVLDPPASGGQAG